MVTALLLQCRCAAFLMWQHDACMGVPAAAQETCRIAFDAILTPPPQVVGRLLYRQPALLPALLDGNTDNENRCVGPCCAWFYRCCPAQT